MQMVLLDYLRRSGRYAVLLMSVLYQALDMNDSRSAA